MTTDLRDDNDNDDDGGGGGGDDDDYDEIWMMGTPTVVICSI